MKIAIVEDEAPIREGLAKILNKIKAEYELVGTASDGLEGLEMIRQTQPDLVIMDIRMPKLNGIAMLERLRKEEIMCKVIVLSAYSEFEYARQAIQLGIENYLLKPIDILELRKVLQKVEEQLHKEQSQAQVFTLDNIFQGCLNGNLHPTESFHLMTRRIYGFTLQDPAEVFMVWLGDGYETQKELAEELLNNVTKHAVKFSAYVQRADSWNVVFVIVYRQEENRTQYDFFKRSVVPMLRANLKSPLLCVGKKLDNMLELTKVLTEMKEELEWGLLFGEGVLICREEIEKVQTVPVKYPMELEAQAKKAILTENREELQSCYERLFEHLKQQPHTPSELKENLLKFDWALVKAGDNKFEEEGLQIQYILQGIGRAVSWYEIWNLTKEFIHMMKMGVIIVEKETPVSDMVHKALELIQKYYDQGVTREEIAEKLFVSEEYLSAQFKKETGVTFTETVRKYRIEKVKKLLLKTHLKLNQIAELSGYSDPKYMSKVFKDEVGMLPNEYRKSMH